MNASIARLGLLLLIAFGMTGCVLPPIAPKPPEATAVTLRYNVPTLTAVTGQSETIERDGIRLTSAAHRYEATTPVSKLEFKRVQVVTDPQNNPIDIRETPLRVEARPEEIRLKIRISNRLDRIVRLAGAVVQWQVAGKAVTVNKAGAEQFLGGIILPRQEGEFEIIGPQWAGLPDNATVALFIYDVVTQTDGAGNPTKRSNFEFFYQLGRQDKEGSFPIVRRRGTVGKQSADWIAQYGAGPFGDKWAPCVSWNQSPILQPAEYSARR